MKVKTFILQKHFDGLPKPADFKITTETLPPIKPGEYLVEATYISVDPCLRMREPTYDLGKVFPGFQVAKVIESKSDKFPVGKYVNGSFGWRTHTIVNEEAVEEFPTRILPDFGKLPLSLALGALGMPGNTAYFGFLEICKPKAGETVVVSTAAGAVGSMVGQIAKIKGCKVIGIAGDDMKGKWLTADLKFDHFINYKLPDFKKKLMQCAPNGIDCFFDNVGGEISSTVLSLMNLYGRMAVCGTMSMYDLDFSQLPRATVTQKFILTKQLKIEGFVVTRWLDRWEEGINQNLQWIEEERLKYKETVTEGFDNVFKAFLDMLQGENIGKAVVKV